MEQVGWVLDHQLDLGADFRTFYRLDPDAAAELDGPEYMALALRTVSYDGAMRRWLEGQARQDEEHRTQGGTGGADLNDFRSPVLAEYFEVD